MTKKDGKYIVCCLYCGANGCDKCGNLGYTHDTSYPAPVCIIKIPTAQKFVELGYSSDTLKEFQGQTVKLLEATCVSGVFSYEIMEA